METIAMVFESTRHSNGLPKVASILLAAAFAFAPTVFIWAEASEGPLAGTAFERELKGPVDYAWAPKSLREALDALAEQHHIAIILDRRVDPNQEVENSDRGLQLELLFQGMANHLDLGVSFLDSVVYFGPKSTAKNLATIAALRKEEVRKLPESSRRSLLQLKVWRWEQLAEPQQLMVALAAEVNVKLVGVEEIPHDLWPAANLPALSFTDRMTLLLAGFDKTFEFAPDGLAIRLIDMPDAVIFQKAYRVGSDPSGRVADLTRMFPNAKIRADGNSILVAGLMEDHKVIRELLDGKSVRRTNVIPTTRPATLKIDRFSVENKRAGDVAKYLAEQLKMEIAFEPETQTRLQKLVTVEVKDATPEEVFEAVLTPVGLTFRLEGKSLTVLPGESGD